ncbi:MAG: glutathione S-transferase family protein [Pseudomonadales bacterium]
MDNRYTVYKSDISYFSGKLEAYLRYKEIAHTLIEVDRPAMQRVAQKTGIQKMPAIEMNDGQWLFDTTPMIRWLETQHTDSTVIPTDPALAFVALLLEDYGDEWLWRPAMWWRWVPKVSRVALGRTIAAKMISRQLAIPLGFYFGRRQLKEWLYGDGMNKHNSSSVRDMLYRELETLEAVFASQPYLLGSHPSIADFGYFASMYRHFGNDPVSAEVVRREAPHTYEWLARLWNAKHSNFYPPAGWVWPDAQHWQPLLSRIAKDYLPYLHQNAKAFASGQSRFDYTGSSLNFASTVTTHYRVWCRQELQREFALLSVQDQQRVKTLFADVGGIDALHLDGTIESGLGQNFALPIRPHSTPKKQRLRNRLFGQPRN